MEEKLQVRVLGDDGIVKTYHVQGTLNTGKFIDAIISCEIDGRDAWFDEKYLQNEGGVVIGRDETGWDEIVEAIDAEEGDG